MHASAHRSSGARTTQFVQYICIILHLSQPCAMRRFATAPRTAMLMTSSSAVMPATTSLCANAFSTVKKRVRKSTTRSTDIASIRAMLTAGCGLSPETAALERAVPLITSHTHKGCLVTRY